MPSDADPTGNAPAATGMLTPQKPEGDFAAAKLDVHHATKLLDRAIAKVGSKSDDGRAMLAARAKLTAHFGEHEEETAEFSMAEIKRMVATLVGPGEPPKPQGQPQQQTPPPGAQPAMQ
jgi:hypothetical protein